MARKFNGSSDLIRADAARLYSPTAAFSVAFWCRTSDTAAWIYAEARTSSNNDVFAFGTSGTVARCRIVRDDTSAPVDVTGSIVVTDSAWHHWCYTQDSSRNYKMYIDATVEASGVYGTGTNIPTDLAWGALVRTSAGTFFAGDLEDGANWSRNLSLNEVKALASGLRASKLQPNHYWPFFGVDSPEPDLGFATHVAGTLTGTSKSNGGAPLAKDLLWVP